MKILIIDGLNCFIRSWSAVPTMDINGEHVGGTVGFLRTLKLLIRENTSDRVVVVWDGQGGSKKRKALYADYKKGRKPRLNRQYDFDSMEDSVKNFQKQLDMTKSYLDLLGIIQITVDDVEADDVIAYLSNFIYQNDDKVIMSSDRDLLQLVNEKTLVYSHSKKLYYTAPLVAQNFGVIPENIVYQKAMVGDGSDNIPGLKGIGQKTVVKLFPFLAERPSSLDEIFEFAEKQDRQKNKKYQAVLDGREIVTGNVKLMQLTTPIIGANALRSVRYSLEQEIKKYNASDLKIRILGDGIQITDSDFFEIFRLYHTRRTSTN